MAKTTKKKKNRKLKRQIRKTVGALLMVSAITVAAIPVQDVSANPTDTSEKVIKVAIVSDHPTVGNETSKIQDKNYKNSVPYAKDRTVTSGKNLEQIIYTSGNGLFQFVYIRPTTTNPNKVAMILGYNGNVLTDSSLTIPDQLEAFKKYSDNVTSDGYCLVSKLDEFLYYQVQEQLKNEAGYLLYDVINYENPDTNQIEAKRIAQNEAYKKEGTDVYVYRVKTSEDDDGNPVYTEYELNPVTGPVYYPCYYDNNRPADDQIWSKIKDEELYYKDGKNADGTDKYTAAGDDSNHWKIKADVAYIGAETIKDDGNGGWVLDDYITTPNQGVFAGNTNITNLTIGSNMRGISDFAFYNCGTLNSITLANGLTTIGNGAFAECRNLQTFKIESNALIEAIGKDAFYNCRSLKEFTVPIGVKALGDNCFEECVSLEKINFLGDGSSQMYLQTLGNHLFKNCSSLAEVEFPETYVESNLDIDMFKGCTSLQRVIIHNDQINFDDRHSNDKTNYPNCEKNTWDSFKDEVPDSFYFEGPENSAIRDTAHNNSVTYKYPNQELYEKVEKTHAYGDSDPESKDARVIYRVNSTGDLVYFGKLQGSNKDPDILEIPEKVGAFSIQRIAEGSFNNNCFLNKVTIPASVTEIGNNAFKGCHNLKTVIYTDASTITSIGTDAFKTHDTVCGNKCGIAGDQIKPSDSYTPELYFVGAMLNAETGADTVPFQYAMNGSSKITPDNWGSFWITCHSGWPTNLEVKYNDGEAQLVGYPRRDQIDSEWVNNLPYVTAGTEKATEYQEMVNHVKTEGAALTPDEQAFLSAIQNVVIPASVASIRPGLFSGVNEDGKEVDEDGKEVADGTGIGPDENLLSILINGVDELEAYTFKGCVGLKSADVIGSEFIDDYAFEDCTGLEQVVLGSKLQDTGKRPFKGCDELRNINCDLSPSFTYNEGILYRTTGTGKEIIECLENRGKTGGTGLYTVGPDELVGVTAVREEAFADCDRVSQVDLSQTTIGTITQGSFKNMKMNSIVLPNTLLRIEGDAFRGGQSDRFVVYFKNSNPMTIIEDAFEPLDGDRDKVGDREVIFQCAIPSNADSWAKDYAYITTSDAEVFQEYTVRFYNRPDYPASTNLEPVGGPQIVRAGESAVEPDTEDLTCNDSSLMFIGWDKPFTNVQSNLDVLAVYGTPEYTVTFIDGYNGDVLKTEVVKLGGTATPPADDELPEHPGQIFMGWDKPHYNISEDTTIVARYVDGSGDINRFTVSFYLNDTDTEPWWTTHASDGEVVMAPMVPAELVPAGYTFSRWLWTPASAATGIKQDTSVYAQWTRGGSGSNPSTSPGNGNGSGSGDGSGSGNGSGSGSGSNSNSSKSPSPSATPTATPDPDSLVKKYTVSVSGGSGSGQYAAGAIVAVNAYYMGEGQVFDKWTSSTAGVGFSNPNATSATFTMPAANVAVTATYKTGSGSSAPATNSGGGGGGNTVNTVTNNGTVVDVTRPGISNTNLAGATVSGATDNFIVKVTEDQAATDAVTAALQARYGDLSRIKYLPMDISLYDSTGRTRIADTSGISVNLTLPLPDDLIQYAGNNRVAAISGGALEDLNARFTTVGGVPCVNFTATHFSPYVIYVDTANLTEATIDTTPKTGDPIHPKWFLAIGLACISLILFFKRDRVVINTKAA